MYVKGILGDQGGVEAPSEAKFRQVRQKLESGPAVLIYDDETETATTFMKEDPLLKKLDPSQP